MSEGLPDLSDLTEDNTAAVIIITITADHTLGLHVYEAEGINLDVSDALRAAMELNDDDSMSGKPN